MTFCFSSIKKFIIFLEIYMRYLIQKHVFVHFLNSQKLLISLNKIDVIVDKSLAKPWLNILVLLIIVLKNVEKF